MWKLTLFSVFIINTFEVHLVASAFSRVPWHPQPPLSAISPHPRPAKPGHSRPIIIPAIIQLPSTMQHSSQLSHAVIVPLPPTQNPQFHQQPASPVGYPSPVNYYPPPHSPSKGNLPPRYASRLPPPSKYPPAHLNAVHVQPNNYKYLQPNVQLPPPRRYLPPVADHMPRYPQPPPDPNHLPPPVPHQDSIAKNTFIPAKNVFKGACPMIHLPVCAASGTQPLRTFYNICFMRLFNLRNRVDYRVIQYGPCKFLNYDGKKAMKAYSYSGGQRYPPHK
ncbi:uncharacterized protein [Anabrus simplex]|uniref:uncharacterized protein n=1 Tax=Anabrus simplex TaxID=316456 RepID=UPI0035A27DD2